MVNINLWCVGKALVQNPALRAGFCVTRLAGSLRSLGSGLVTSSYSHHYEAGISGFLRSSKTSTDAIGKELIQTIITLSNLVRSR
uniref:Uncharacterized protein n=1 Tax=Meloidogyne enterolobii TaxID=390850 RepID=A0A6V7TWP2_MELEN|nr:unnamed protein product [Meloidogyne enterolobii]